MVGNCLVLEGPFKTVNFPIANGYRRGNQALLTGIKGGPEEK